MLSGLQKHLLRTSLPASESRLAYVTRYDSQVLALGEIQSAWFSSFIYFITVKYPCGHTGNKKITTKEVQKEITLLNLSKYINNPQKTLKNTSNYNECTLVRKQPNITYRFKYTLHQGYHQRKK
jgi:hypothetical protein